VPVGADAREEQNNAAERLDLLLVSRALCIDVSRVAVEEVGVLRLDVDVPE